uniref:Polyprotein n=1 Tax=Solanum tuberosum TaxID=4113 RepID=M1CPC0_SOLTU
MRTHLVEGDEELLDSASSVDAGEKDSTTKSTFTNFNESPYWKFRYIGDIIRSLDLKRREEEKGEEEANFVEIVVDFVGGDPYYVVGCDCVEVLVDFGHVSGCVSGLNLWYVEGFYDIKCLGLEPLKLRWFRVGKMKEKGQIFGENGWGVAPASAPQKGL